MPQATIHFPRGFLWGTASSSHQVEGGNTNNQWHAWEQDGRTEGRSGLACDWWGGRWKEDFDRAAEAGQNAHRLSIEWSRIQPGPDRWDEDALDHYRQILRGLRERGMTAMVTLHHFTDPIWLAGFPVGLGAGWETQEVVPLFAEYVRRVVEALREYCNLWITINEPNLYAMFGYILGTFPPGKTDPRLVVQVQANMARAHAAAYQVIHELQPEAKVGYALHYRPMVAARPWSPFDRIMRNIAYAGANLAFPSALTTGVLRTPLGSVRIPEARGTQDFFGLNYYSVDTARFDPQARDSLFLRRYYPEGTDLSESGFTANQPHGLFDALKWAVRSFPGLPVIVTENGMDDAQDRVRPRYLAGHVRHLWRAVNFVWPVKGYFHWTLVDNFEWERGWSQRFGLWELDLKTQVRRKRPSADLYAAICRENGLSTAMVEQYCPEAMPDLFPG